MPVTQLAFLYLHQDEMSHQPDVCCMQAEAQNPPLQPSAPAHDTAIDSSGERQQRSHITGEQADAATSGVDEMQADESLPPPEAPDPPAGTTLNCYDALW